MAQEELSTFLSIVVPAYNEAARIQSCINDIKGFLTKFPAPWEALIVVEKSTDQTALIAQKAIHDDPHFKLILNTQHKGKGFAVKTGMLQAKGQYVFFMDTDLSTPLVEIFNFMAEFQSNPQIQICIGDRKHKKSKLIKRQNWLRQKAGEFFNFLVQLLVFKGIKDTQCGFKAFKKETIKPLFENLKTNGFAFDVEILMRAKKLNYHVQSLPVQWINSPHSKVNFFTDSLKMLFEIILIKLNRV